MDDLNDIKSIPVWQVALDLGINKFNKSICFNHHENVPSLSFNTKDNYLLYFLCNIGESVIDLVKGYLRLNTAESIKYLINK